MASSALETSSLPGALRAARAPALSATPGNAEVKVRENRLRVKSWEFMVISPLQWGFHPYAVEKEKLAFI